MKYYEMLEYLKSENKIIFEQPNIPSSLERLQEVADQLSRIVEWIPPVIVKEERYSGEEEYTLYGNISVAQINYEVFGGELVKGGYPGNYNLGFLIFKYWDSFT